MQRLLDVARQGKRVVVCMDETQAMPLGTLESVRLLTNLETEKRKLMQVVLFGQPELDRKLASESVRQLRQRITFQYRLKALARNEVSDYVAHRLTIAGYSGPALFTNSGLRSIQLASRGIPRLVNILAHKALLLVYAENGRQAERRHVVTAIEDTRLRPRTGGGAPHESHQQDAAGPRSPAGARRCHGCVRGAGNDLRRGAPRRPRVALADRGGSSDAGRGLGDLGGLPAFAEASRHQPGLATRAATAGSKGNGNGAATPPATVAEPTPPGPVEAPPVTAPDTLRLAREIETPLRERAAKAPKLAAALPALPKGTVDKRDRVYSAAETADAQFRRAAVLLNQGRLSEAEDHLAGALRADPSHGAARQTYVAMLLEQHRVEAARRLLQEALAVSPAQPAFAVALARIYTEQRDYRNALEVLDKAGPAARNAEFQAMRGAVLQRLGKHAEAVEAYQNAIRIAPQPGTTWVGLAISLETLGRRPEAAQAYRRALDAGSLAAEAREYAESRARALE